MRRCVSLLVAASLAMAAGASLANAPQGAHEVVGKPVLDGSGNRIGEVKDALPAPAGSGLSHLVIEFDPKWHDAEGWLAVPWKSFGREGDAFVARFDADDIRPAAPASAPPPPPPPTPPQPQPAAVSMEGRDARLTRLVSASVSDSRGERLGAVTDLVVDMAAKRIVLALVAPRPGLSSIACVVGEGGLSIASDGFLLPAEAASLAELDSCAPPSPLGPAQLLASRLLRTSLVDVRGDVVGSVVELVVRARDGSLHYAVGDFAPQWLRDGLVAALPLRPLRQDDGGLQMVAYMDDLYQMPVFDQRRIADVWSPLFAKGVDKYLSAR